MKKVLVNLPDWDPTYWMKNTGKLIRRLAASGVDVHVFCLETSLLTDLRASGLATVTSYKPTESRFFGFLKCLLRHRFDFVLWTYSTYRENILLAFGRMLGGPRYAIKSDSFVWKPGAGFRKQIGRTVFDWVSRSAELVIAESPKVAAFMVDVVGEHNVFLMPNGVPIDEFRAFEERYRSEQRHIVGPYFMYCGRIAREKGIDLLIDSFSRVADEIPDWTLQIVGPVREPTHKAECDALIRSKNLENRIVFCNMATGVDLYRWYYFADVFTLPSRKEGLANVIPEALFFRTPIIAYDVGESASLVRPDVGLIVPALRPDLFADAMRQLAEKPEQRKAMAAAARSTAVSRHDDAALFDYLFERCAIKTTSR